MMMTVSPNPKVIMWAIARCGKTIDSLEGKWPKIRGWLDGSHNPTLRQIEDFAKYVHVGIDLLFGDEVPRLGLQIADFRTAGALGTEPSTELYDTITQMQYRQDWLRDYFSRADCMKIGFVGLLSPSDKVNVFGAAEAIRSYFGLTDSWAFAEKNEAGALKTFRDKVEARRVSVVINGVVGDNTSRPLDVSEFRGFVLADDLAPIVFINGRDAKSAQIFTLAHELAHLAFDQTGVVQPFEGQDYDASKERLCDAIAAEVLVPKRMFLAMFPEGLDAYEVIDQLRRRFKVSFIVCARRALDLGLINQSQFGAALAKHESKLQDFKRSTSGGNYYLTKAYRIGQVFGDAVFAAVRTREITYREAFRLTGLSANTFDEYFGGYAA